MSTYDNNAVEFYNDLVLATALRLIVLNGCTTTLDIKNELRDRHSLIDLGFATFTPSFTQDQVSDSMNWLANNNYFIYTHHGVYRTYYLNLALFNKEEQEEELITNGIEKVSLSDALDIINDMVIGKQLVITFIKKDKSERTINAEIYSPNKGDGYIKVIDRDIEDVNNIRTIDLRRILSFEYDFINYIIDKSIK